MSDDKFNSEKKYVGLSDPNDALNWAKLYLDHGQPYQDAINPKIDKLRDAHKIRNRVTHSSSKCKSDFKDTAMKMLGVSKLKQSCRPADLLAKQAKKGFGSSAKNRGISIFEAYMEMYIDLAKEIVPN